MVKEVRIIFKVLR